MRTLYFDIDGSLLIGQSGIPKPALAHGAFEQAVRRSGIEHLVCIGLFVDAGHVAKKIYPAYDIHGAILQICGSVFENEAWFRASTSLTRDSSSRATDVDLSTDWWYLDDLSEHYFALAGREDVFKAQVGRRIFVPTAEGDGQDVLNWLGRIA